MRFLGVDLAWKDGNASGVALLGGERFPLRMCEAPHTIARHEAVLAWIARHVARHRGCVAVDAPLLGLGNGRRGGDNEISSAFGRFHAATHSPPRYPGLDAFSRALRARYGLEAFGPGWKPAGGRPVIREVYPNALQVLLFGLDRQPGLTILKYKQRRFTGRRAWVEQGLGLFVERCIESIGGRYVVTRDPAWRALAALRPRPAMSGAELKGIEDRWDAVLCALGAALECLEPGTMRFYPAGADRWQRGYILAPTLPTGIALPLSLPSAPPGTRGSKH